jgi:starch-binding outer membrane protein, SusD/RagB family
MKNIYIYITTIVAALTISCNDTLDIEQAGQVTPEQTYTSVANIEKNLYGLYALLSVRDQVEFNSNWTDEAAIGRNNAGQALANGTYSYSMLSNSPHATAIYQTNYVAINNANRFIIATENFISKNPALSSNDLSKLNHMIAEAKGLRAFSYHELITYFVSNYNDDNALGVILFDNIPTISTPKQPRASVAEVYNFIETDLDFVLNNINPAINSSRGYNTSYFISKNFVYALRARMYLYRGDNYLNQAIEQADLALQQVPDASYQDYTKIFNDTSSNGVILKFGRRSNDYLPKMGTIWMDNSATLNGALYLEVGRSLFNLVEAADIRDKVITNPLSRLVASNYSNSTNYLETDVLPIGKYVQASGVTLGGDQKIFRSAEMTLIKAEAKIRLGLHTQAQNDINTLRNLRFNDNLHEVTLTADMATNLKILLTERRLELAFEGFRWVDIKRLGVLAGNVTFDRDPMDCQYNNSCNSTPSPTDYRFTLPIPQSQININSLLVQNPGY